MPDLSERFEERLGEIRSYLSFLEGVETLVRSGVPRLGGASGDIITPDQQRILYSVVYLQLYNLVESTITRCLDEVSKAAMSEHGWAPGELTAKLRSEWVRHIARTHVDMGADKRLTKAIHLCEHLIQALPVAPFEIERGGGGNWDDNAIRDIAKRIGCPLKISSKTHKDIKRVIRNEKGAMALIVDLRNKLAHGSISFVECGQDDTVNDLKKLSDRVEAYLKEVIKAFSVYIEQYEYIQPESRPAITA